MPAENLANRGFKRVIKREDALKNMEEMEEKRSAKEYQAYLNAVDSAVQHPADEKVQHKFCWAMAFSSARYPSLVAKAGGLEVILKAMTRFPKNERLLAEGCEAVRNLVEMPDGAELVIAAGGLEVVLAAMTMNPDADWVQQEGCGLVCRIITESDQGREEMLSRDGLALVMKNMEAYPRASWVALWGCQAMTRFAELDPKRVENIRGFEAAENARNSQFFQKPPGCPAVMDAATDLLRLKPPGQLLVLKGFSIVSLKWWTCKARPTGPSSEEFHGVYSDSEQGL
eukprot:CAMPEP_0197658632 /NCGR_PEP_ID=MMETSP1338-20131121/45351_1 /TAXON_ID=43686 ORGANISM="Pelagodinium beii, Strain RCC1491" /NCGR_SAMPLE_ID=MMETSP1338 /ASSEMBLY_ACC=CAM_ASM_000754 /LENGTH=284 /DNA_ID=CAMNT_0043235251 /DNA_START=55 /DNA_END=905 /DNA_ORIENTATION=-